MKNYTYLLWVRMFISCTVLLCCSSNYFSQNNSAATANYYVDQLSLKGIQLEVIAAQKLSITDFEKISDFDFNPYRNEKTEKGVQLENGPYLLLRSLNWMIAHDLFVSEEILQRKSGEIIDTNLRPSVVWLQIGIGLIPASNGEKWSTPNN